MEEDSSINTIAKGALIAIAGIIISKLLGYAYRLATARLGTEAYGLLNIGLALYGIIVAVALFGLGQGIMHYISVFTAKKDDGTIKGVILFSLKLSLIMAIASSTLLFIFSSQISILLFHNIKLSPILKILALVIPFDVARNIALDSSKGFKIVKYDIISKNILENVIKVTLTIIFILLGWGIIGATMAYASAIVITAILAFYWLNKKVFSLFNKNIITKYINKEIITYSWPLLINTFVLLIICWSDTIMLGMLKNASIAGIYNAAVPTSRLIYIFAGALTPILLPILSNLKTKKDDMELVETFEKVTRWIMICNLLFLSFFVIYSAETIAYLFGNDYVSASVPVIILSIGYIVFYNTLTHNNLLLAHEKTKAVFKITTIGAILNIMLNLLLISSYGMIGASIATAISLSAIGLLTMHASGKIKKIKTEKKIRIILSAIASTIIIMAIKNRAHALSAPLNLIIGGLALTIVYIALLIITGGITKEDLKIIKTLKQTLIKNT